MIFCKTRRDVSDLLTYKSKHAYEYCENHQGFAALLDDIRENLIDGDMNGVKEGVNQALADGIEPAKF